MISIVMAVRIRSPQFMPLWDLTMKSIHGILETVEEQFELIVIDNGSHSDEYSQALEKTSVLWGDMHPNMEGMRILRFDEHQHLPVAWNEGINQADGDWILIANNDIIYHQKGWERRMVDEFSTPDGKVGIVGIQHMSWAYFSFVEGSLFMFPASFREEFNLGDESSVKVFDEQFVYICDVDLNHRVQNAGYITKQVANPPLQPMYLQHLGHRTINTLANHTDFVGITHQDRIVLCEKWGFDPQIND